VTRDQLQPDTEHRGATGERVLLIDLARYFGGTEQRVLHLATLLKERGAEVVVVCLDDGMLLPRLRELGVACEPVSIGRADPRLPLVLARLVRRFRPTVVDTHGVHSQFWGLPVALRARVPSVLLTVHSEYGEEQAGLRRGRWYEQVLRTARRSRATYIAVSEPVRRYLHGIGIPDDRIRLLWNAVPKAADDALGDPAATRRSLGLPEDAFVVTTAARLHPSKGHRFFVDALTATAADLPHVHWLIVGEGREEEDLRRRVEAAGLSGRVHLLGFRDDVPALMHASDAFVLPSLAEGLPLVVLEATLQGLPVLTTTVGGLPFAYEDGEIALVPPEDPAALAERLRRLVTDVGYRERLARTGQAATRDRLTTETLIDLTLETYARAATPEATASP
jgi:glycosyltransferase involved in cell wall biosynthesis